MRTHRTSLLVVLGVLLAAAQVRAQSLPDFLTARGIAIGGTRAFASGTEAIFLNPAGLLLQPMYEIEADYGHDAAPASTLTSGNGLVASVVDSRSNPYIATGFSYRYASLNVNGFPVSGSVYDVALATSIGRFALLGIHGTYLSYSDQNPADANMKHITGDVGAMVPIGPVVLSAVGSNLISVDNASAPIGVSAGVAYTDRASFSIGGDVRWQWWGGQNYRTYSVGGEYLIAQMVPVRVGFLYDGFTPSIASGTIEIRQPGGRFLTAGSGFYFSSFGVDATYRHDLLSGTNAWVFAFKVFIGGNGT